VGEDGAATLRLSPTNLGMLLNARIAALEFGIISPGEFIFQTRQTLERVMSLPKHRGHLLNWYDIDTLTPLEPLFVSTVDSGNLVASLWTLKQASLTLAAAPGALRGLTPEMKTDLAGIAATCEQLVREMDFSFLYLSGKKTISVGYDVPLNLLQPSCYDLLASEARVAVFVAIAKGDIPQKAWFHLGRTHTMAHGARALLSWTGTMFEYLMPTLWMRHYPGTIMEQSLRAVVRAQRAYARRKGVPWGISESACVGENGQQGYAPFGLPSLALKREAPDALVISPYSTMLALGVDPRAALKNLRQMEAFEWSGRYGFYEAVDYSQNGGERVRSWMAHHQGMALLAICNLLLDRPIERYFHAEPQVLATELLLHERAPAMLIPEVAEPVPA
jgi:cyclic beta-1,2-glucan synthetase